MRIGLDCEGIGLFPMKMNLNILADMIADMDPQTLGREIPIDCGVAAIRALGAEESCNPDYAYLVPAEDMDILERFPSDEPLSFLVFGPEAPGGAIAVPDQWRVLFLETDGPASQVMERACDEWDRYAAWYSDLDESVLRRDSVQEQLDVAARLLANPIALFDLSNSLVAWSGELEENTDDPIWRDVLRYGYAVRSNIPRKELLELTEHLAHSEAPAIVPPLGVPSSVRAIQAVIRYQGAPMGYLVMDEHWREHTLGDLAIVDRIQTVLGYSERLRDELLFQGEGENHLVGKVFSGEPVDDSILERFLLVQGWTEPGRYRVVLVSQTADVGFTPENAQPFVRKLRDTFPGLAVYYSNQRIAVVDRRPDGLDSFLNHLDLLHGMDNGSMLFGASMVYGDYHLLPVAVQQASIALSGGQVGDEVVVFYESEWERRMVSGLSRTASPAAYCHPAVFDFDLEDGYGRELFETLEVYLACGRHPGDAARKLSIHRNTLSYRLDRIEGITGLDLDGLGENSVDFLRLSCMLARHVHMDGA